MKNKWNVRSGLECIGNFWIQPDIENYVSNVVLMLYYVSNVSNLGTSHLAANRGTNTVAFVRKKAIITRTVRKGKTNSVKNCNGIHAAVSSTTQSSKRN